MTARERETRRRRLVRQKARERAEREWVCGGPLVDHAAPIIGGGDAEHREIVLAELVRRQTLMQIEALHLARHFARRCLLRIAERAAMMHALCDLLESVGPPYVQPTHSTMPGTAPTDIPRLESGASPGRETSASSGLRDLLRRPMDL